MDIVVVDILSAADGTSAATEAKNIKRKRKLRLTASAVPHRGKWESACNHCFTSRPSFQPSKI